MWVHDARRSAANVVGRRDMDHAAVAVTQKGADLVVTGAKGSDAWRHTAHGFVGDDAHAVLVQLTHIAAPTCVMTRAPASRWNSAATAAGRRLARAAAALARRAMHARFDAARHRGARGDESAGAAAAPPSADRNHPAAVARSLPNPLSAAVARVHDASRRAHRARRRLRRSEHLPRFASDNGLSYAFSDPVAVTVLAGASAVASRPARFCCWCPARPTSPTGPPP